MRAREADPRAHAPDHRALGAWCGAGAQWMPADQMSERTETGAGGAWASSQAPSITALVCEGLLRRP